MKRLLPYTLLATILFICCTPTTPDISLIEKAYRHVWTDSTQALSWLRQIDTTLLSVKDHALYRICYSIAAYGNDSVDAPADLTKSLEYYRVHPEKDYLFVAIVQQARNCLAEARYEEAQHLLHEAQPLYATARTVQAQSLYHSLCGYLYRRSGDYEAAITSYEHSQSINRAEGYTNWLLSNAINLINIPGVVPIDSLSRFITCYEPILTTAYGSLKSKFYNNVGNLYKRNNLPTQAIVFFRKALEADSSSRSVIPRLNYAQMLLQTGQSESADSIYQEIMLHADSTTLHRLYYSLYQQATHKGDIHSAQKYMETYLTAIHHIYETRDRTELLDMQAKYARSELLRQAERNRNTMLMTLLLFILCLGISYGIYTLTRYVQCVRLGRFLQEYQDLMREYRQSRKSLAHKENELETLAERHRQQNNLLIGRIDALMKDCNRFRTIYRIHTPHITVTPQDVSALNFFLQLHQPTFRYDAARHRSELYHWVNLTDDRFAERLLAEYPRLTPHDLDLCCYYRMGFNNDQISGFYGHYSDTVRRHRLRLYPLLNVKGKEEFDRLLQQF